MKSTLAIQQPSVLCLHVGSECAQHTVESRRGTHGLSCLLRIKEIVSTQIDWFTLAAGKFLYDFGSILGQLLKNGFVRLILLLQEVSPIQGNVVIGGPVVNLLLKENKKNR